MKKSIIKYRESYVFLIVVIVFLFVKFYNLFGDKMFFGLLAILITFYLGMIRYRIENDKLFKELFVDFNKKYDEKFNDKLNGLIYSSDNGKISKDDTNLIIDYFNLCAEEYLWWKRNRIPNEVWRAWKAGILVNLEVKKIKKLYEEEIKTENGKISYYGLAEELERSMKKSTTQE